ncbi:MAG: exonuclease domain-containing protein [Burkholderiales bacterium]
MRLFAPSVAFVDLETTGTHAGEDRITEVGIVRVDEDAAGGPPRVHEWSSLVDPEVPIPPAIQALTGITDAMVRGAPTFAALAGEIEERIADCVFVAHNARFDHGFLKHAFARAGRPFNARPLCTVRLSRRLFPEAQGHGLDAIVARHALPVTDRHRALGDARALWSFVEVLYRTLPAEDIEAAVRRILKIPSFPPQLPPDVLETIPERPGVYLFYGSNPLPIYVGKSVNLRDRVASHFSGDWRTETDLRLSQEIRRIEVEETAGELGALLREATLVKSLLPAHNRALRKKAEAGVLALVADAPPEFIPAAAVEPHALAGHYGPFTSKRGARETLRVLAAEHALCWVRLGLEKRDGGPCFQRQLKRCAGACVGAEPPEVHDARLAQALAGARIPAWPLPGIGLLRERAEHGERVDVHVLRDWCWLGTARDDGELASLLAAPPRPAFDIDVTRLLQKRWAKGALPLVAVPAPGTDDVTPA